MKLVIHTKNYVVSDRLKTIIEKKIEKMRKYFDEDAVCMAVCTKVANMEKMEITITAKGHAFRAQEENRSMYSNIDVVLAKIERQIVKNKERLQSVVRREAMDDKKYAYSHKEKNLAPIEIMKNKAFDIRKLTAEEAKLGIDTLDHDFFVYADKQTGGVRIMYRRDDGNVGIIEVGNAGIK